MLTPAAKDRCATLRFNCLRAVALIGLGIWAAGCGTRQPVDYTRYVRALEERERAYDDTAEKPDRPESPVRGLPRPGPVPAQAVEIRKAEITIQPDSLVQVRVDEDPSLNGSYPVNSIGAIQLGYVGPVILLNKTEQEAAGKIGEVLRTRDFKNATVAVRILRASYDTVGVFGSLSSPGVIKIGSGDSITLSDALLRAGGLAVSVRGARVKIVRDGLRSPIYLALEGEEYALMTEEGVPAVPDVRLRNNDVAYVFSAAEESRQEAASKSVLVLGEVNRAGLYTFAGAEPSTIMHLLFKMGGLPPYANGKAIRVIRRDAEGEEREFKVNARRILATGDPDEDFTLQNGDRILVPARRFSLF